MKFGSGEVRIRKVLAIAAVGVAGSCGVAACASASPAGSRPGPAASVLTPGAQAGHDAVARDIARIAAGKGGLPALYNGNGQATMAYCDPGTVPDRLHAGKAVSASCGVNYSDGSVWRQTVTVTFGGRGIPVADGASLGTEVLQPTGG